MSLLRDRIDVLQKRCNTLHSRLSWMRQSRNYWRTRSRDAEKRKEWGS